MKDLFFLFIIFTCSKSFSQDADFSKLKGKSIKVNYTQEILNQSMYIYVNDSYTEAKNDSIVFSIKGLLNEDFEKINLIFKYNFNSGERKHSILKYTILTPDEELITKTSLFSFHNNKWILDNNPTNLTQSFLNVFSIINIDFYNNINSPYNDPNFPKINNLKPLVKNAFGIVNIKKLEQVLKDKKETLNKYLD